MAAKEARLPNRQRASQGKKLRLGALLGNNANRDFRQSADFVLHYGSLLFPNHPTNQPTSIHVPA
jgi:hypothetical protein